MTIFSAFGPAVVTGALVAGVVAVPAAADPATGAAAAAGPTVTRVCTFEAPKKTTLRIKVKLKLRERGSDDVRRIRVRATDNRRVDVQRIVISVENEPRSSGGGMIGSASAVSRNSSPATWRLNPRSNGADVERVVAQVTFRIKNGPRVVASCAVRP
ncbi:hypothetical protein [Sporichthya brevicatena]